MGAPANDGIKSIGAPANDALVATVDCLVVMGEWTGLPMVGFNSRLLIVKPANWMAGSEITFLGGSVSVGADGVDDDVVAVPLFLEMARGGGVAGAGGTVMVLQGESADGPILKDSRLSFWFSRSRFRSFNSLIMPLFPLFLSSSPSPSPFSLPPSPPSPPPASSPVGGMLGKV
jgi:hypothetical protein